MAKHLEAKDNTKGLKGVISDTFSFPHPVNEFAARLVAMMVMSLTITIIVSNIYWLLFLLTYGFLARVLTGPTLSPMGLIATKILVTLLGNPKKLVADDRNGVNILFRAYLRSRSVIGHPSHICWLRIPVGFLCWMLCVWAPNEIGLDTRRDLSTLCGLSFDTNQIYVIILQTTDYSGST